MRIQILVDNPNSWIIPFAEELKAELNRRGHDAYLLNSADMVRTGDILFLLSCEHIFKKLDLNTHNLVIHESALPLGKGWSPVSWQILEGKSIIPITLFEADMEVDSGVIYFQEHIELDGYELVDEIRQKQGLATIHLALKFVDGYNSLTSKTQEGESTYYPRRTPKDSELDVNKTIVEQFNLLRVCDNERYPALLQLGGSKYVVKIEKR